MAGWWWCGRAGGQGGRAGGCRLLRGSWPKVVFIPRETGTRGAGIPSGPATGEARQSFPCVRACVRLNCNPTTPPPPPTTTLPPTTQCSPHSPSSAHTLAAASLSAASSMRAFSATMPSARPSPQPNKPGRHSGVLSPPPPPLLFLQQDPPPG